MNEIIPFLQLKLILRLIIACVCGIAIGFERKNRAKEAGVRTHCIVACASCLMMIISKYGFFDIILNSITSMEPLKFDPSRMASGIVTGVGFLGAGIIFVQRGAIKGLTTAAGIWATSGIGMAIGAGMYLVGTVCTVIILLVQIILHSKQVFMTSHKQKELSIYGVDDIKFIDEITGKLEAREISVFDVSVERNSDCTLDIKLCCDMPSEKSIEEVMSLIPGKCKIRTIS